MKILPHISVSKEVILKVFNLIVTHIPIGYNDHLDDYGLFDSLSKFESYIINRCLYKEDINEGWISEDDILFYHQNI